MPTLRLRRTSSRTQHHLDVVFKSSLGTAHRTGVISVNPMNHLRKKLSAKARISDEEMAEADASLANAIGTFAAGFLGNS